MANLKNYTTEIWASIIAFVFLWWVLTNANPNLGNVYLWAIGISFILLFVDVFLPDRNPIVTFEKKKGGWLNAIFQATIGWVVLLIASFVILNIVDPAKASISSIMKATNAANPAFSNSLIVNWLVVTFAIGYGETQFFARLMKFLADRFGIQINRQNKLTTAFVILVLVLMVLFGAYHLTAKGVENTPSLIVVGLMMGISLFLVALNDGETKSAVVLHWISNGIAGFLLIKSGGLIF